MAPDSRSPAVPAGGPPRVRAWGVSRRAPGPGSGAESPSSWETGCGRKGGRPLARHATHVRGEPGAKPFVDDLLLGRGFVRSRAAPSLRSIESQPSTQGFVSRSRGRGRAPAAAGTGARPSFRPSSRAPLRFPRPGEGWWRDGRGGSPLSPPPGGGPAGSRALSRRGGARLRSWGVCGPHPRRWGAGGDGARRGVPSSFPPPSPSSSSSPRRGRSRPRAGTGSGEGEGERWRRTGKGAPRPPFPGGGRGVGPLGPAGAGAALPSAF